MSSIFEGPPQDSRIASASRISPRPWTTMIAAFAAGVAFTFLLVTVSSFVDPSAPPETKPPQRMQSSTNAAAPGAVTAPTKPTESADSGQADPTSTRSARVTDGSSNAQAGKVVAPPVPLTTNGGVPTERPAERAQELAGAPGEQGQVGTTVAPPVESAPAAKPRTAARPAPAQPLPKPATEKNSRPAEASVRENPRTRTAPPREPQAAATREPQAPTSRESRAASSREPQQVTRATSERSEPGTRMTRRETWKTREISRTTSEQERRPVRQEAADEPDDAPLGPRVQPAPEPDEDGYTLLRVHRQPDGRRATIYERRTSEPARVVDDEEAPPPRPRPPFAFNPAQPGD
jgi:hypothetical protein